MEAVEILKIGTSDEQEEENSGQKEDEKVQKKALKKEQNKTSMSAKKSDARKKRSRAGTGIRGGRCVAHRSRGRTGWA